MSTLFSTPKVASPRTDTKAVQEAQAAEAAKRRQGKGYQSTILTSLLPQGKTTLGGADLMALEGLLMARHQSQTDAHARQRARHQLALKGWAPGSSASRAVAAEKAAGATVLTGMLPQGKAKLGQ